MEKNFDKLNEIAEMMKAIAHPVRLCIVAGLIEKGQCNVGHMQTCMDLPQSTVSQHLQKLRAAGVVEGKRNGSEISYRVRDERIIRIVNELFK